MADFGVIMPAAGDSSRFRDQNYKKPFAPLDGKAVWLHSAERFLARNDVKQVVVVIAPEDREEFQAKYGANLAILGIQVVNGGATRAESVKAGLAKIQDEIDFVAVHDAARPVWANEWIDNLFRIAEETDAAILANRVTSTLKRVDAKSNSIKETVSREGLWQAQTPQVFRQSLLSKAYEQDDIASATDDAELVQRLGHDVKVVEGSPLNLKITTKADLKLAGLSLKALPKPKLEGGNPFANDDMWR